MTNPATPDAGRPPRNSPPTGESSLQSIPKLRIIGWALVGLVTLAGVVLYFLYGDFVSPVLVMHDAMERATVASFPALLA